MKIRTQIRELYNRYGFEEHYSDDNYSVYILDKGYFKNAELLIFNEETCEVESKKMEIESMGYSCKITKYINIEILHNMLFSGFFNSKLYKQRTYRKYEDYIATQTRALGSTYSYIKCKYSVEGEYKEEDIIDYIISSINEEGPVLIVIEAPAGYGKTCTSYEILSRINKEYDNYKIPMMTELSQNRTAKIFKYVLLDEIDKCFGNVDSTLVKSEINDGKIPLIIDGLDELIVRKHQNTTHAVTSDNYLDDISSMLNTIGELLVNESKIILTSRKSALLTGDKFNEWLLKDGNDYTVKRIIIHEPSIKDWIGFDKYYSMNNNGIELDKMTNPVILAYIRNLSESEFNQVCCTNEALIDSFFTKLLSREIERQGLSLNVSEQLMIFRKLAYYMASEGFTSDTRENMKDHIVYSNIELLEEAKTRYYREDKKGIESIANSLAGHVLIDRVSNSERVGFINEFIFGILIGDAICEFQESPFIDYKFIDMACTAFKGRSLPHKLSLLDNFKKMYSAMLSIEKLGIEMNINNQIEERYLNESFDGIEFTNIDFIIADRFIGCTFYNCTFKRLTLNKSCFSDTVFLECKFYECIINDDCENATNTIFECIGDNLDRLIDKNVITEDYDDLQYERMVIEKFWPRGRAMAQQKRARSTIFLGTNPNDKAMINAAIDLLIKKGILKTYSDMLILNYSMMKDIIMIKKTEQGAE